MKKNLYSLSVIFLLSASLTTVNAQTISTVAGTGCFCYNFDGVPATAAGVYWPWGVATDAYGNFYIADTDNERIRKVDAGGIINTIGGTGVAGYSGDGGNATAAKLGHPIGIDVDLAGNVYFGDKDNNRIRKINTSGIISTIAGTGIAGFSGDGGQATAAQITVGPVALDKYGNLYFGDGSYHLRKVDIYGVVTTIAGTGAMGFSGDGGPATAAALNYVNDVAVDTSGNIYINDASNARIRKINTSGIIYTIAGTGVAGFSGDGGPATAAKLGGDDCLNVNRAGEIVFGDYSNSRVRKIDAAGTVTTIGGSTYGYSGDGGPATAAQLKNPNKIAFDQCGNIYITDIGAMNIRKITLPNHAPAFSSGDRVHLDICENGTAASLDSILAATDTDVDQLNTWSFITTPLHGTLAGTAMLRTTGSSVRPTGLTYTPTTSYAGLDSFIAVVTDCNNTSDTITVLMMMNNCALQSPPLAGAINESMNVYPNPAYHGKTTVVVRSLVNEDVHYVVTNVLGERVRDFIVAANTPTDIQFAKAGFYFIKASTQHGNWEKRIAVQGE